MLAQQVGISWALHLVSSDNGAAFAFPMVADEELFMFTHDMNQMALDLGMSQSEFVDPAGIYDGNISTARDLTRASIAAAFHPVVSIPGSAKQWAAQIGDETKHYVTTNKTAGRVNFLLAKRVLPILLVQILPVFIKTETVAGLLLLSWGLGIRLGGPRT